MIAPEIVGYQIRNYPTISISLILLFYRLISFLFWGLRPFKIMSFTTALSVLNCIFTPELTLSFSGNDGLWYIIVKLLWHTILFYLRGSEVVLSWYFWMGISALQCCCRKESVSWAAITLDSWLGFMEEMEVLSDLVDSAGLNGRNINTVLTLSVAREHGGN